MKLFNKTLSRILCLVLALCMVAGCFAGCDGKKSKDDEKDDLRDDLKEYSLNGLHYYLSDDFGKDEATEPDTAKHTNDDNVTIEIFCGPMEDVVDGLTTEEVKSSKEFAKIFEEFMSQICDTETDSENGVHYVLFEVPDVNISVCGFYVEDDYGWVVTASAEDSDYKDDLIKYATLGEIDKDFDVDDYVSASSVDTSDDDTDHPTEPPIQYEDEVVVATYTVYAYVPESWGYPGCWAWSSYTGENVFDAWPGQPMNYESGNLYSMEIPSWADYIIINGLDGTIQTEDEPVDSSGPVWVIISSDDQSYEVLDHKPSTDELSYYGY